MDFVRATHQDIDTLRRLAHDSEAHWGFTPEYMEKFDSTFNITADFIKKNPVYAGIDDGQIVCFWGIMEKEDISELEYFYTSRSYIGKGCGRLMWNHFTEWCRANHVRNVEWVTSPEAIGFYLRMGAVRQADVCSALDGRPIPSFFIKL